MPNRRRRIPFPAPRLFRLGLAAALLPAALGGQEATLTEGLAGYWSFDDEGAGPGSGAADFSDNGRHAEVLSGEPSWVEGRFGGGLDFDGDDSLQVPGYYGVGGAGPRTIALWIRTDWTVPSGATGTVGWGSSATGRKWHFKLETQTKGVRTENSGGNNWGDIPVNDGQWHHVASVLPEGGTRIGDVVHYVDGVRDTATNGSLGQAVDTATEPAAGAVPVTIGSAFQAASERFVVATLDEVAIWDRALPGEEIAELAAAAGPLVGSGFRIRAFGAAPASIRSGQSATLQWELAGPDPVELSVDNDVGDVRELTAEGRGSAEVAPAVTTTYTLSGSDGETADQAAVTVFVDEPFTLRISEILAANDGPLEDEDGDTPDWVEIENLGATTHDLAGWFLTDDPDNLTRWRFPPAPVEPGGFLVVFASGKDRAAAGAPLHAGFKISTSGEYLALVEPDGTTVHDAFAPAFPAQVAGFSYGVERGSGELRFFTRPTPEAENGSDGLLGFFDGGVTFSVGRGFFDQPFEVELTAEDAGAEIYYTTNGREPNRLTGTLYGGPVPVETTTVLRAAAFKTGFAASEVGTRTYLFPADVVRQPADPPGFPDRWGPAPADYAMDVGTAPAEELAAALRALPTISVVMDPDDWFAPGSTPGTSGIYANSTASGSGWERPGSVELFDFPHGEELQADCGVRIYGNASRQTSRPKHNIRLVFRRSYGPAKLRFDLFDPDSGNGGGEAAYNSLLLRGQNGDSWFHPSAGQRREALYIRDQFARDLQRAMGRPSSAQGHAHVYLNGLYWGVFNTVERIENDSMARMFGGAEEEWEVVKATKPGGFMEVVDKGREAWSAVQDLAAAGLDDPGRYAEIQRYLDLGNFVDFMLVNFFNGNVDWDNNNWQGARRDAPGETFKFFTWDSERTLLDVGANNTTKNNADFPTRVHQRLRANPEYRIFFADRMQAHFFDSGALTPDRLREVFNRRAEAMRIPLLAESARWSDHHTPGSRITVDNQWQAEVDFQNNNYLENRPGRVFDQLKGQGLYPDVTSARLTPGGGAVEAGTRLTMLKAGGILEPGAIYFTLDGTDPRMPGGAIAETATRYVEAVTLERSVQAVARVKDGPEWSALTGARLLVGPLAAAGNLVISELMYNPPGGSEGAEFIEVFNTGEVAVDLSDARFVDGVAFTFPLATVLEPGGRLVVAGNREAFEEAYGDGAAAALVGTFAGDLKNDGETLELVAHDGATIERLTYNDREPWPRAADGDGHSLVRRNPRAGGAPDDPASWRSSALPGGAAGGGDATAFVGVAHLDADRDGLPALLEYALGTADDDPAGGPGALRLAADPAGDGGPGGGRFLTVVLRRSIAADDVEVELETSGELSNWEAASSLTRTGRTPLGDGTEDVTYRAGSPLGAGGAAIFVRVRVRLRE